MITPQWEQQTVASTQTTSSTNDPTCTSIEEYVQRITRLLSIAQRFHGQIHEWVDCLSQEVLLVTKGHAQLILANQKSSKRQQLLPDASISIPVQFGNLVYGALYVAIDPTYPQSPALPLSVAQLLARVCSWLLYAFEQLAFLQRLCQQLDYQEHGTLTKREREVLALILRGYSQEAIAKQLCIAPTTVSKHRQHIYEQLGVHNEHDVLLAAYQLGLFSFIEESTS